MLEKKYGYPVFAFLLLTFFNSILVNAQQRSNTFEMAGLVQGLDSGTIFLGYYNNDKKQVINDSSPIKSGSFSFKGVLNEPTVAFIKLYRDGALGPNSTEIFLEPSSMSVSLKINDFKNSSVSGSLSETDHERLRSIGNKMKEQYKRELDELTDENFKGDKDSLMELLKPLADALHKNDYDFFLNNPSSIVTAYFLQYHIRNLSIDSLIFFYNRLGTKLQQNIVSQQVYEVIKQKKVGSIGSIAKPFSGRNVDGDYIFSKFFKNNYLILDFWASWCIPCRQNTPHLISIYNLYKDRGLKIIGIADNDNDTTNWKKAILNDGIGTWTNILRGASIVNKGKGVKDQNDIYEKYGVNEIPVLILINPEGIIIGRFKGLEDNEKLKEQLQLIFGK